MHGHSIHDSSGPSDQTAQTASLPRQPFLPEYSFVTNVESTHRPNELNEDRIDQ